MIIFILRTFIFPQVVRTFSSMEKENSSKGLFSCYNLGIGVFLNSPTRARNIAKRRRTEISYSNHIQLNYTKSHLSPPHQTSNEEIKSSSVLSSISWSIQGTFDPSSGSEVFIMELGIEVPKSTEEDPKECIKKEHQIKSFEPGQIKLVRKESKFLGRKYKALTPVFYYSITTIKSMKTKNPYSELFLKEPKEGEKIQGPRNFEIDFSSNHLIFGFFDKKGKQKLFNLTKSLKVLLYRLNFKIKYLCSKEIEEENKGKASMFLKRLDCYFGVEDHVCGEHMLCFTYIAKEILLQNKDPFFESRPGDIKKVKNSYKPVVSPQNIPPIFTLVTGSRGETSNTFAFLFYCSLGVFSFCVICLHFLDYAKKRTSTASMEQSPRSQKIQVELSVPQKNKTKDLEKHQSEFKTPLEKDEGTRRVSKKLDDGIPHECKISLSEYYLDIKEEKNTIPFWQTKFLNDVRSCFRSTKKGNKSVWWGDLSRAVKKLEVTLFDEPSKNEKTFTFQHKRMEKALSCWKKEKDPADQIKFHKGRKGVLADVKYEVLKEISRNIWETGAPFIFHDWENCKKNNPLIAFLLVVSALYIDYNLTMIGIETAPEILDELNEKLDYIIPIAEKFIGIEGIVFF